MHYDDLLTEVEKKNPEKTKRKYISVIYLTNIM